MTISRALLIVVALGVAPRVAAAYPQFQFSSGTVTCAQCHFAPAGGGLLTQWGQTEFADTVSLGGDGRFLHGLATLPDWLSIGGDVRLAALANDVGATDGTELAVFPMQLDLAARVASGAWSVMAMVGARGVVRSGAPSSPASVGTVMAPSLGSYVMSREHYVMWKPDDLGAYARIGRYAAPYGLRLSDHTAYVRRYLGYNVLEETYGAGGGWVGETAEVHATAFVYDPLQFASRHEVGAAAMLELHPGDAFAIGASGRVGVASASTRIEAGLHGKVWIADAKLLFQTEVDGVRERFDAGLGRWQLAGYAGPVLVPARGTYAGVAYEAFAEDLRVKSAVRHAADVWFSFLPTAHVELMVSGRAQRIGPAEHAYVGLLQVHYAI